MKKFLLLAAIILAFPILSHAQCTGAHCNTLVWVAPASQTGVTISGYNVYRSVTAGGEIKGSPVGTVAAGVLTYTDNNIGANGGTYYYTITTLCATCTTTESVFSNEVKAVTPIVTVPGAPTGLTVTSQ